MSFLGSKKKVYLRVLCTLLVVGAGVRYISSHIDATPDSRQPEHAAFVLNNKFSPKRPHNFSSDDIKAGWRESIPYYSSDGGQVFFGDDQSKTAISGVDIDSFLPLLGSYALDDDAFYIGIQRYPFVTSGMTIFQGDGYLGTASGDIYSISEGSPQKVVDADHASFRPLSYIVGSGVEVFSAIYARDDNNVYYRSSVLTGYNPDSVYMETPRQLGVLESDASQEE